MRRSSNRWAGLVILGLALLLLGSLGLIVEAQGNGVLEGQVVNGTVGGPEVGAGITITLHIIRGEVELDSLQTTANAQGGFRFEGLDTDAKLEYWPEAFYLGVPYSNPEPSRFGDGESALQATVTVYETTDDDSAIALDSVHIIAESFEQMLRVSEIHLFSNAGDRTFVGRATEASPSTTLQIPLPSGAVGFAFQQDMPVTRFVEVENGLLDTEPVPPGSGTAMVFFSYHLVVDGETVPLERRFAYPVDSLNVLVAQPGLTLRSDQLLARGAELFQGRQYEFYTTQALGADTPLALELLPTSSEASPTAPAGMEQATTSAPTGGNQGLLRWLGLGLAVLAVVGALVYPVAIRRPAGDPQVPPSLTANAKARRLVADLADLEVAFEAGQIDAATYERQRADKYEALKSL
jgi:hypothetical protein